MPLPPLEEQRKIAVKAARLMALVDQLETQLATARGKAQPLLEAVARELLNPKSDAITVPQGVRDYGSKRAAIGCYVIGRMAGNRTFGRTALMKLFYLSETHLDCAIDLRPMRDAAGPYDPWIEKFESLGVQNNWFDVLETNIGNGRKKFDIAQRLH